MLTMRDEVAFMGKLILPSNEAAYMGKVVSTGTIDTDCIKKWIGVIMAFLQLAIAIMTVVMEIVNALDDIAAAFWQAWDGVILRWQLYPVSVAAMG